MMVWRTIKNKQTNRQIHCKRVLLSSFDDNWDIRNNVVS